MRIDRPFADTTSVTFSELTPVAYLLQTCATTFGAEIYKFQPRANMVVSANTSGSNFDTVLSVGYYAGKGKGQGVTELACDDDGGGFGGPSALTASLTVNTTYYFVAAHFGAPVSDPDRSLSISVTVLP